MYRTTKREPRPDARRKSAERHAVLVFIVLFGAALAGCAAMLVRSDMAGFTVLAIVGALIVPLANIAMLVTQAVVVRFHSRHVVADTARHRRCDDVDCVVVIPVMIRNHADVAHAVSALDHARAATAATARAVYLLVDFADAPADRTRDDDVLRRSLADAAAIADVRDLADGGILIRPRVYNPAQACWMGWERKRGKVQQFLELVRDGHSHAFEVVPTPLSARSIRLVMTVDVDARLAEGCLDRLIGCWSTSRSMLREAPALFVPRIEVRPTESANLFATLQYPPAAPGVVSHGFYRIVGDTDVFEGKGLIDVDRFLARVGDAFAENTILSHDHLEGFLGRTRLVPDAVLVEDAPIDWLGWRSRQERWIRGDTQTLPWLFSRHPRMDRFGRLKIVHNVFYHLSAPLALLAAVGLWTAGLQTAGTVALSLGIPGLWMMIVDTLLGVSDRATSRAHILRRGILGQAGPSAVALLFYLDRALVTVGAVTRSLWRMSVSRRHMLEWRPSDSGPQRTLTGKTCLRLWRSTAFAGVMGMVIWPMIDRSGAGPAAILLTLWAATPLVAVITAKRIRRSSSPAYPRSPQKPRVAQVSGVPPVAAAATHSASYR